MEHLLTIKLNNTLENENRISPNQYGFRLKKSTTDAINKVVTIAREELKKPAKKRKLCAVLAVDVKNAFNSASWSKIVDGLKNKNIPNYLVRIFQSYFTDRRIIIPEDDINREMTVGVPQGSCVGPVLWNVMYNDVLEIDKPEGITLIAYADDLAIIAMAENEETLEEIINLTMERVNTWMTNTGLALAPEKTEAILLIGKKKCRPLNIELAGNRIEVKNQLKYLGITLDTKLNFNLHLEQIIKKARISTSKLSRILPRQGGAGENKRRVLQNVSNSVMLYAAPVWSYIMEKKTYKKKLLSEQRKMAIRVSRAHRTAATEAVMILARTIPIDLIVKERKICYGKSKEERVEERRRTLTLWQQEWDHVQRGLWTKRLIPNIKPWYEREFGEVDQHIAQAFTGHGSFNHYLHRIGKRLDTKCSYCDGDDDTAEHTIFQCDKWRTLRTDTERMLNTTIAPENIVPLMIKSSENWKILENMIRKIMMEKEKDGRERENTQRQRRNTNN
ncbi:hypothetical protein M8J77_005610 [Diaphorina citri]|nr:hypothetical protein M8J77_005610 [Diaphorina citri]